jgi:hypothetical protein
MLDWGLNASGLVKNPSPTVTGLDDIRDFPPPFESFFAD